MTLTLPYQPTFIVADGTTRSFNYLFDAVSADFIGVAIKRTDGSVYQPVFAKDLDQQAITLTDNEPTPELGALVCIYRNTPEVQDVAFRTLDGYNARALENILSKIVAMIQETRDVADHTTIRTTFPQRDVSIQVITDEDDTATVVIDAQNKQLKRGLYFKIADGNLLASQDGQNFIQMPKSADIKEFRQVITEDNHYVLQYRVGNTWYGINLDAVANQASEALEKAEQGIADADQAKKTADVALAVTYQLEESKADKTKVYNKDEADAKFAEITALSAEKLRAQGVETELQADIDRIDGKTAELDADLASKVDKDQGAENAGKFLKVGADGNVTLGAGGGGGSAVWGEIEGNLSDQTDLSGQLQNIREVAEGKTNSYVVSYANNPDFNTTEDSFVLVDDFVDINGVTHEITDLKLGDVIFVEEVDVPDRWCSNPQNIVPVVPEGYTQLEYIESTGTQYINTGKYCYSNNVEIDMKVMCRATSTEQDIISNYASADTNGKFAIGTISSGLFLYARKGSAESNASEGISTTPKEYVINAALNPTTATKTLTVNGQISTAPYTVSSLDSINPINICRSGHATNYWGGRIYYLTYKENGTVVMNLVPCRRDSDSAIGLYDTVTNTFMPNSGAGTFGYASLSEGVTLHKLETAGGSGVTEVAHDDTLSGKGTTEEPLSVIKPAVIIREW